MCDMDLLTPSINVPAERARLRTLRDEIHADAQHRLAIQRKYTARGFLRDVQPLEAQGRPGHGEAQTGPVRASAALGVPAAVANVLEAQAGFCIRCGGPCRLGSEWVKAC
jgi:hypothetical protein